MESVLLTIREAAALVGIPRDRAYALVNNGEWPTVDEKRRNRLIPRAFLRQKYGLQPPQDAPTAAEEGTPNV